MSDSEAGVEQPVERWVGGAASAFLWLEHAAYVALGVLLSLTALLALGASATMLWHSLGNWGNDQATLEIIDHLLFVLMLIEILHTVRASMRTGGLTCEPFLVVGLIASIRRVLVIALRSSQTTEQGGMTDAAQKLFQASMIELVVLALLIAVMVVAIYILHKASAKPAS
jgi:uncharacterized membrane protein (DUF373 family)